MNKLAVSNYLYVLEFIPECYKTQRMCKKVVDTYPSTIKFVPECSMTQKMCDEVGNIYIFFVFDSITHCYKTQ